MSSNSKAFSSLAMKVIGKSSFVGVKILLSLIKDSPNSATSHRKHLSIQTRRSSATGDSLDFLNRINIDSIYGQKTPVVVNLAQVIVEMRCEMSYEIFGWHRVAEYLYRVSFCKVIASQFCQRTFYHSRRCVDVGKHLITGHVPVGKFRITVANII